MERELIRERILLGLERRRKQGKTMGRPKGSTDKKRRTKSGYYLRWGNKKTSPHKNKLNNPINSEIKKE
jgi:DNA invertase Pin-like site-specific DNA recombinase